MPHTVRYYSRPELAAAGVDLTPEVVMEAAQQAWSDIRGGRSAGLKSVLLPDEEEFWRDDRFRKYHTSLSEERLGWKLSALSSMNDRYAGVKVVGANAVNRQRGEPRSQSTFLLMDRFCLKPLVALDFTDFSAARTATYATMVVNIFFAGVSGLSLFIFGAGPVAEWILRLLDYANPGKIRRVYVRSRTNATAKVLARRLGSSLSFQIMDVADNEMLRECEFVITATSARSPVFSRSQIADNTVLLHLSGDETPSDFIEEAIRKGTVLCDDISLVSHRKSQSLALYFSRRSSDLEALAPALGIWNLKDAFARPPASYPVLVTCVGLPLLDLCLAGTVYDRWLVSVGNRSTGQA